MLHDCPPHTTCFDDPKMFREEKLSSSSLCSVLYNPVTSFLSGLDILLGLSSQTLSIYFLPLGWEPFVTFHNALLCILISQFSMTGIYGDRNTQK
jgi:hypothetical protein